MSPKSLVLIGAAVAVFAAGVYLFIQVKATPAQAQAPATGTSVAGRPSPTPERGPEPGSPAKATPMPKPGDIVPPKAVRLGNDVVQPQAMASPDEEGQRANPKLDSMMELANKAYDRQDFDEAIAIAGKVLTKEPNNVRMLRIMVSANCIQGDAAVAQQHYERLPTFDRDQMKARCDRYQVTLKDPAQ